MTQGLSRRAMLMRLSSVALLAGCGRGSSSSPDAVHIATAAGALNQTMSELMRQQKFLESFDLVADVAAMADGNKILGGVYSGSIDVSPMSGFGQVFPAIERGADLKIINAATLIPWQALFSAKPHVQALNVHAIPNGNMAVELKEFTYQAGWTTNRAIQARRDVLVRVLAAYAKLFRFVGEPSSQDAYLRARKTVFPDAPEREHLTEWNHLQTDKPFASDLMLSPERVRYMQQINLDFKIQNEMLPFERVVDLSLAEDAQKLLGT